MRTKQFFLILLLALLVPWTAKAEVITIGTGESMYDFPFHDWYYWSWDEEIYPMSAFSGPCTINSVSYNNVGIYGMMWPMPVIASHLKIYLGERATASHSSDTDWTPLSDLTLVYSHENVVLGAECGWEEFVFDEPFTYEHNGNLVIVVATAYDSPAWDVNLRTSSYSDDAVTLVYSSWSPGIPEFPTEGGQLDYQFADIQLNVSTAVITCPGPRDLTIQETSSTTATFIWTAGEGTSAWDVYVTDGEAPTPETTPTATGITTTSYTFTGLNSLTNYTAYVRSNCGEGDVSVWKSIGFMTAPDFGGGGTAEMPYLLYTKDDLEALTTGMAAGFATQGKYFKVMHDIDDVTTPISGDFRGDFNGNGHTITLNLEGPGNLALFATFGFGANIHDLIVDGTINSTGENAAGFVAELDGDVNYINWTIDNCVNRASITSNADNVGGFVGFGYGNISISNCVNRGTITTTGNNAGGFIGICYGWPDILNCENKGSVSCSSTGGGIAGRCAGNIINCANKGSVTCPDTGGGIVGNCNGAIVRNCYNIGVLTFGTTGGGISGYNINHAHIENCYNGGMMTANNTTNCGAITGNNAGDGNANGNNSYNHYNYYKEGTYSIAYGTNSNLAFTDNYTSFTQSGTSTVCTLAEPMQGTTDLLTALNNWRNGDDTYAQWYSDLYGNNNYMPTFTQGTPPGLDISPNPIVMAPRPIGAWMQGEEVTLTNTSQEDLQVSQIDFDNPFFVVDESAGAVNIPFPIYSEQSKVVYIGTDPEATVLPGSMHGYLAVAWNQTHIELADIEVENYMPETPDVVELAEVVTTLPQTYTQNTNVLYDNYKLLGNKPDGPDGVYQLTFAEDCLFSAQVTEGANAKLALYAADFNGRPGPMADNYYIGVNGNGGSSLYPISLGGDDPITNLQVEAGTYYLVVSSTSPQYTVEMGTNVLPLPLPVTLVAPADGATDISSPIELQWQLGQFTTEYQLLMGTSYPPTNVMVGWTPDLAESYLAENLQNNQIYFWRVNERNSAGVTTGPIWAFTTTLNIPTGLHANTPVYVGEDVLLQWTAVGRALVGYNVYQDGVKITDTPVAATEYAVSGLAYNMEGYTFAVSAVYNEGESGLSESIVVRVGGFGTISGTVYEQDGTTPIAGATVTVNGYDEFYVHHAYTYLSNANGAYSGTVNAGHYIALASKEGYQDGSHQQQEVVNNGVETENVDIILYELHNTVGAVVAQYYPDSLDPQSPEVKIYWESEAHRAKSADDRSFQCYRIYRTNCYNYGPYTEENTVLLASDLTDTLFVDGGWPEVEPGVYKWGVSRVYAGNRESQIVWSNPSANDNKAANFLRSINAYSFSRYSATLPDGWIQYEPTQPLSTAIQIDRDLQVCAGDFCADGYVHAFTEDNQLLTFDPGSGQVIEVINTTNHMDDCAYDYSTNTLFGVTGNILYTVNLSTGALTAVGMLNHDAMGHSIRALACSYDGHLYGFLDEFGALYSIDRNTAQCSLVGYGGAWLGDPRMSAGFDHNTGTLYWIALDAGLDDFIGTVDTQTGEITFIANGMGSQRAFCVPYGYTPTPTSPESDIVWSNCLDKDMWTTVEVSVSTNTGDSPEGTIVTFINTSEPNQGYDHVAILDDSGYYQWEGFRKGTYTYTIEKDGYTSCANHETVEIMEPASFECMLQEIALMARNLYVSPTGWAMWKEGLGGDVLHYDTDAFDGSVGASGSPFYWAVKFTPEQLEGFHVVNSVSFYDAPDQPFNGTFYVCTTNTPMGHVLYQQSFVTTGSGQYIDFPLSSDVEFNNAESLWIVFHFDGGTAPYPASGCTNTGDANGRWISTDGLNWGDIASYGLNYTWKIRCHVKAGGREERTLEYYHVFLDDLFAGDTENTYLQHDVDNLVEGESYTTKVQAVYSTGESEWAEYTWTYIPCDNYEGVTDYDASANNGHVSLNWAMPENQISGGDWYYYDDGNCSGSVGTGGGSFYWGIMLPAGTWQGQYLGKVAAFEYASFTGNILVYQGGDTAPQTLIYSQQFVSTGSNQLVEYPMNSLVELDESQNLWVLIYNISSAAYPAAYSVDMGDPNSRWISMDGSDWHDLTEYNIFGTWIIRAYTTDEIPVVYNILGTFVFRDGELLTETPLPSNVHAYTDNNPTADEHEYSVRVVYDNLPIYQGDYYAMSCTESITVHDVLGIDENEAHLVSIYPNPAKDKVTIESEGMRHITVVDALGQVVYDAEQKTDQAILNLSAYGSGVYMIRIITEHGTATRRVTVTR